MNTNLFFGYYFDAASLGGESLAMLLSVLLGGAIGLERQWRGNAAGLRTHILVCVGSTVITLTSVEIGMGMNGARTGDPGRIAAQIVSGIGFLGAGAILRDGATVHGLTTAASIWVVAGIGITLGASPHLGELAVVTTVIVLITLIVLSWLERTLKLKPLFQSLEIEVKEGDHNLAQILDMLGEQGLEVHGIQAENGDPLQRTSRLRQTHKIRMRVKIPRSFRREVFNKRIIAQEGIVSFQMD